MPPPCDSAKLEITVLRAPWGKNMSRLLILMLSMGLIACQQQSDTAADAATEVHSAEVAASADAAGPKLYVFDCGRIRLVSIEAFNLKETDTDVRELSLIHI